MSRSEPPALRLEHLSKSSVELRQCAYCHRAFAVDGWAARNRASRFCSRPCFNASHGTPEERFWKYVAKQENGCWLWTGTRSKAGYGQISINNKHVYAHRFSYELHKGPLGPGEEACHDCPDGDNPGCVAPDHLFKGDHAANMRDMVKKGHGGAFTPAENRPRGDKHWRRRRGAEVCQ